MVKVKIIRHSERLDFTYPYFWIFYFGHYWADSPLTTDGHKYANDKGKYLINSNFNPKYIYTSPYTRTMSTATEIQKSCQQSEIVIEPLLSEYQPSYKHKINLYPDGIPTTCNGIETEFSYPETFEVFNKRVNHIITKLLDKNSEDFVVVTHGELLKTYINYVQSIYPDLMLDPGTTPYLTTLSFEYDKNLNKIIEKSVKLE